MVTHQPERPVLREHGRLVVQGPVAKPEDEAARDLAGLGGLDQIAVRDRLPRQSSQRQEPVNEPLRVLHRHGVRQRGAAEGRDCQKPDRPSTLHRGRAVQETVRRGRPTIIYGWTRSARQFSEPPRRSFCPAAPRSSWPSPAERTRWPCSTERRKSRRRPAGGSRWATSITAGAGREADRDLAFVEEHARRLGLPFASRHRDARAAARTLGLSPEAGARLVRYEALHEMAQRSSARASIATAHQQDDAPRVASAGPRAARRTRARSPDRATLARTASCARCWASRAPRSCAFLSARGLAFRRDASNGDLSSRAQPGSPRARGHASRGADHARRSDRAASGARDAWSASSSERSCPSSAPRRRIRRWPPRGLRGAGEDARPRAPSSASPRPSRDRAGLP